ncbi:hypothetical protein GCM10027034_18800 [Ramlibacter solisilvae]|uniref:chemotaxis protein CheW n=1 Tax=Ramlibacter tataouinensis TaxID=94132 RepID=UPI000776B0C1|nr:chemotaxis protein CheW [Ramlibacter tataouinensis]
MAASDDGFAATQSAGFDCAMSPVEALTAGFAAAQPLAVERMEAPLPQGRERLAARARQGFRVGELRLMVRFEEGSELTEMPPLYRLPNAPAWFRGMANLHGALTPVFDLSAFAGLPAGTPARQMLLVLAHGADAAGVVIDGMPQRLRFAPEQAAGTGTAPPGLAAQLRGAALVDGDQWFDLDCAALLDALEQALAG